METLQAHLEADHRSHRTGWLRAAVLGANDGLISTGSLVLGMATANAPASAILLSGVAGLAAGAFSMAAGEYVSVSSQTDAENADLARERKELAEMPEEELEELTQIYQAKGLDRRLAEQVAVELTQHDALGAHAESELGIDPNDFTNPVVYTVVGADAAEQEWTVTVSVAA